QDKQGRYFGPPYLLGSPLRARHLSPTLTSAPHCLAIRRRGQQLASLSGVLSDGAVGSAETLGMTGRCEPLPAMLALTRRPMGGLTPVIERATLAMFHPRQPLTLGRAVAL